MQTIALLFGLLFIALSLPILITTLTKSLVQVKKRVRSPIETLGRWTRHLWAMAGRLFLGGRSVPGAIQRGIGNCLMISCAVGLVYTEYVFLRATLETMLDLPSHGASPENDVDLLVGGSLIISVFIFMSALTDLVTWTNLTRFSDISRARSGAFRISAFFLLLTLGIAIGLGFQRSGLLLFEFLVDRNYYTEWMEWVQFGTFVLLALVLLAAVGFALIHIEGFGLLAVSLLIGALSVIACVSALALKLLELSMDLLDAFLTVLTDYGQHYKKEFTKSRPRTLDQLVAKEEDKRAPLQLGYSRISDLER